MPMREYRYTTPHGIEVTRTVSKADFRRGLRSLLRDLDSRRGIYLSSGYEYPGRYSRWDIASVAPPVEIVGRERQLEIRSLNERGQVLIQLLGQVLSNHPDWDSFDQKETCLSGKLKPLAEIF